MRVRLSDTKREQEYQRLESIGPRAMNIRDWKAENTTCVSYHNNGIVGRKLTTDWAFSLAEAEETYFDFYANFLGSDHENPTSFRKWLWWRVESKARKELKLINLGSKGD